MKTHGHFYGVDGKGLYKIIVTEAALCGAKIAGPVYDEASARAVTMHFGLLGWLIGRQMGKSAARKREATEQSYNQMEPGGPVFMNADKANFSLGSAAISRAKVQRPRQGKLVKNAGSVELQLADGKKRRFNLLPEANAEAVREMIARVVPVVEIVD